MLLKRCVCFPCIIVESLPYSIKNLQVTVVVIWSSKNQIELNWIGEAALELETQTDSLGRLFLGVALVELGSLNTLLYIVDYMSIFFTAH